MWSEIPRLPAARRRPRPSRRSATLALQELREDIVANRNHPSVMVWSIGNEMPSAAGPGTRRPTCAVRPRSCSQLDPTRPVGLAFAGHPETPLPDRLRADRRARHQRLLRLVHRLRRQDRRPRPAVRLPRRAARAATRRRRSWSPSSAPRPTATGPVEEKGTYAFQQDFIAYHLGVFASKPWLTGASTGRCRSSACGPAGTAATRWRTPPFHTKGVVRLDWTEKPGYAVLRVGQRRVRQFVPPARSRRAGG